MFLQCSGCCSCCCSCCWGKFWSFFGSSSELLEVLVRFLMKRTRLDGLVISSPNSCYYYRLPLFCIAPWFILKLIIGLLLETSGLTAFNTYSYFLVDSDEDKAMLGRVKSFFTVEKSLYSVVKNFSSLKAPLISAWFDYGGDCPKLADYCLSIESLSGRWNFEGTIIWIVIGLA